MAYIICPNGASVYTMYLTGSVLYNKVAAAISQTKWTHSYRAKCISAIGEVGLFGENRKEILEEIRFFATKGDNDSMRLAAQAALKAIQQREMRQIAMRQDVYGW